MARLKTVRIVNPASPGGFTNINEADFDPAIHQRPGDPATAAPVDPNAQVTTGTDATTPQAGSDAGTDAVDADLVDMPWGRLRSLAAEVSDDPVITKDDAIKAIMANRRANK